VRAALLAALLLSGCASHQTHLDWEYEAREICSVYSKHPDWHADCAKAHVRGTQYWYFASWVGYAISLPPRIALALVVCVATPKNCESMAGIF
jgi:hypothetical protein